MTSIDVFASIVITNNCQTTQACSTALAACNALEALNIDYEVIIVDCGAEEPAMSELQKLTHDRRTRKIRLIILAEYLPEYIARWVGIENSIGDYVAIVDSADNPAQYISELIEAISAKPDIILLDDLGAPSDYEFHQTKNRTSIAWRLARCLEKKIAQHVDIPKDSSNIAISRDVVSYLSRFRHPYYKLEDISKLRAFKKAYVSGKTSVESSRRRQINWRNTARTLSYLKATSKTPLRAASILCSVSSLANLLYCIFVVLVWIFKGSRIPGWYSLSLQQAAMMFLMSTTLLLISEYLLEARTGSPEFANTFLAREIVSASQYSAKSLNLIEESISATNKQTITKNES